MSVAPSLPLPVSAEMRRLRDLMSPGLLHDLDAIEESPIESVLPDSASDMSTAATDSKDPSVKDGSSKAPSLNEKETAVTEVDEVEGEPDEKSLANYVVPVLDKGVKNALLQPTTPWIRFRVWYNPYRMFFTFVFALNMAGIVVACTHHFPYAEQHGAALALGNILAAVFCRNEFFLRYLFWVVVKVFQKWSPLWVRIFWTAFLQHVGGIHSGAAASGVAWFIFIVVRHFQNRAAQHIPKAVLGWGVVTVATAGLAMLAAAPWIRANHHNMFEWHHRFAGWSTVAFVWIFVCLVDSLNVDGGFTGSGRRLSHAQEFWFALFITIGVFLPWTTVRKVPVEITTPSPRVAVDN